MEILILLLFILILAIFLGFEIISKVPSLLHTPLMSGSNAISGITVLGAMVTAGLALDSPENHTAAVIGALAVFLATINVFGGYLVTQRMLNMFKKKDK
ncbi:MAG: NAD(P) transhydrogenase subunit alpha [Saprospiraceae bacterium]|nr:NAD(P) transhydrogenase subunit alpha [Saprospiraceae bacterium]